MSELITLQRAAEQYRELFELSRASERRTSEACKVYESERERSISLYQQAEEARTRLLNVALGRDPEFGRE